MDKELKAAQQVLKALGGLSVSERSNVITYVNARVQTDLYRGASAMGGNVVATAFEKA